MLALRCRVADLWCWNVVSTCSEGLSSSGALCWQIVTHLSEELNASIVRADRSRIDMLNTLEFCHSMLLRFLTLTFSIAVCCSGNAVKFEEVFVAFPTKFTFCVVSWYAWNQLFFPHHYRSKSCGVYFTVLRQIGQLPSNSRREITNSGSTLIRQKPNQEIFRSRSHVSSRQFLVVFQER